MKNYSRIIIVILLLMNSLYTMAQYERLPYKSRIYAGFGGEDSYLGVDYLRNIYKSQLLLGIGCGLGTGWTVYARYEPLSWYGLGPFISSGVSHTFGGTLTLSPGTSTFSTSAGLNYLPKLKWKSIPVVSIGMTYYSILSNEATREMNGWGPLIKIGIAFSK